MPPAEAWVARLAMARLCRDDEMTQGLLAAMPRDLKGRAEWIVTLAGDTGMNVRRMLAGNSLRSSSVEFFVIE